MILLSIFQDPDPRFSKVVCGCTTSELFWSQCFEKLFPVKATQIEHSELTAWKSACCFWICDFGWFD